MRLIQSKKILAFLDEEGIKYTLLDKLNEYYTIASIFEPINNGFYFYLGNDIPNSIANSVLLLSDTFSCKKLNAQNIGIFINKDPQKVFYKLLLKLYQTNSNGQISDTAIIHPEAKIGKNVQIDHFSIIGKVILEDNVIINSHCTIHDNTIVKKNTTIESHSIIGTKGVAWVWNENENEKIVQPQLGGVEIKENSFLGANTIIVRGSINEKSKIGKNTLLAPGCRIGHGTVIGDYVHLANNVVTGGNTRIGNHSFIGSAAVFRPKINLHESTIVGAGSVVVKNTTEIRKTLIGVPAKEFSSKINPSGMPKPKK